jgi:hypothetical protein
VGLQSEKNRWLHCNECGRPTNQLVLHEKSDHWSDAIEIGEGREESIEGGNTYSTTKCLGCDTISYLTETWFSQETEPDGQPIVKAKRYPPSMARRHPEWFTNVLSLPPNIREFLQEIYVALQNGSLRLCALGTRALIEQIIVTKVGDRGSLGANIEEFLKAGYVAQQDHKLFREKVVELGNAAMHRGYTPASEDIHTLLDITEALVASIYVHPHRVARMGQGMPPRVQRKK